MRSFGRVGVVCAVVLLTACGSNADSAPDLPPLAAEGRDIARSNGCSACHGGTGSGGVGPAFVGLFGSEVTVQDGPPVVADRAYLVESIVEPSAKLVEGFNLPMPKVDLSTEQIDAIIAYIEALGDVAP